MPKTAATRSKRRVNRWSGKVKTVSTFPPEGTFTRSGEEIARIMARPRVSPGGLGSAIRMVVFFRNRAGRTLPAERRAELDQAVRLLQEMNRARQGGKSARKTSASA